MVQDNPEVMEKLKQASKQFWWRIPVQISKKDGKITVQAWNNNSIPQTKSDPRKMIFADEDWVEVFDADDIGNSSPSEWVILPTRKKDDLIQYFTYAENRSSVQYVVSDMYEPYLLVTTIMFPKAKYVVDRFHYIRYIMDALDKIRIRLQKEYGIKSKEYNLLKNKKNVSLLRKYSNKINWWVEQERYRNGKIVRILPGEIRRCRKIIKWLYRFMLWIKNRRVYRSSKYNK